MPIASAGSSSAPKDSQMARYYHIGPKPALPNLGVHHHQYPMHGQLSPVGLQVSVSPNGNSSNHPLHHHHPHLFGLSNGVDLNRPHQSCVQDFSMQSNSNMRQITPPLTINVNSPIHQEVSAQVTSNSSNGLVFDPHSPPAPNALLNLSPGLNPALEQHRTSPLGSYELPHRRSLQEIHSNVAGPVQQHSPLFYSGMYEDSGRKSESPTRKRRRTSMSSHSVIDLTNPNSPPSPSRPWDLIMLGDRAGLNINHHQRRRSTTPRRGTPIAEPSNTSRHRRSPTMRRVRYRDRQSPERRAFQPPPPMPTHHPLSSHLGFHPAMMPHHGQHGPLGPNHQMPPTASQPVVINVDQVSIPVAISPHNIPLYTSPHPIPICTSAHVPPCGMQAMHNCGQMQFSSCQMPHLGSCGNLHLSHHHHMYPPVIHPHSHQPTPSIPGQHHLLPPQFVQQPQMLPQVHDGELHPQDMLSDHRTPGFPRLQPSQAAAMHPGPSLAHTPPLHVVQEQNVRNGQPDLHFPTLCSYVPHPRRASTNRRTASRRWRTPLPTSPAALPGFLLHVFAMFSNPSLPAYGPELVNQENAEAENYEALLNLAERLGEAKPRGLLKSEIDQLPSYRFNAETHQSEQTCCVVCMCDFEQRQLLRVLPCNHEFHAKCVDKWLKTNRTCPICRGDASEYFNHNE